LGRRLPSLTVRDHNALRRSHPNSRLRHPNLRRPHKDPRKDKSNSSQASPDSPSL